MLKSAGMVPAPSGSSEIMDRVLTTLVIKALYRILHDRHVLSISDLVGPARRAWRRPSMAPVAVTPPALPAPSGYSHGPLAGNPLYLGGQTALDADMKIVPGGIVEQFRQAFGNVLTTLREAGGGTGDLVSVTIYLTDIPDYQAHGKEIGRVWRELAGPVYPAMAGIGTTALWQPEAMIEILGVAVIPESRLVVPRVINS